MASTIINQTRMWCAYLLGFLGVLCFAATLPLTSIALVDFSPLMITATRGVIAACGGLVVILLVPRAWPTRNERRSLLVSGLALIYGFPLAMAIGLESVPSYHGAVVLGILPLLTAGLSAWIHGYRARVGFWLWAIAGAISVFVFVLKEQQGVPELADLWLLLAAFMASYGYVVAGDLAKRRPGWWVISWSLIFLAPISVLLTWSLWPEFVWSRPSESLLALLALGLFSMFFGFFAWNAALAMGGVAQIGQVQLLQVFLTLCWASLLLGEAIRGDVLIFAGLVVISVYFGKKAA
ncbi:DMT family transporter [Litorivicinus sp.]|nr:DMT family transporter [Litorivicinus sp.]